MRQKGKGVRGLFNSIQTPYVFVVLTIRKTFLDTFAHEDLADYYLRIENFSKAEES